MDSTGKQPRSPRQQSEHNPKQNPAALSPDVNWDLFRNILIKKNIAQKSHRWYALRVERFLGYLAQHDCREISESCVSNYLQAAMDDSRMEDWQVRQLIDAIQIYAWMC